MTEEGALETMDGQFKVLESYWPADTSMPLWDMTIGQMLRRGAQEVPERVAFVEAVPVPCERRRWTYASLLETAERIAASLLGQFSPGERIAVWAPNSAEWILLQHGASLAGLVLVTVNPAYLANEVLHVLETAGVVAVFHAGHYRGMDMHEVLAGLRQRLPKLRSVSLLSDVNRWARERPAMTLPAVQPADTVQIQFTSGTTGRPKGACLHHRGLINTARFAALRAGFPDGGVWVTAMPLFHVGGSAGSQLGAYSKLGTFVLLPSFDAAQMLEVIESEGGNHVHAVPTMLLAMLDHPDLSRRDLRGWHTVMSGGSPVPASLVRRARETLGLSMTITFGQTELNGVICQTVQHDSDQRLAETIGRPAPHMELKIADPATGAVLPLGVPGEIWVRGYQAMHGYLNPSPSEPSVFVDGWLRTGDQASMDGDGYLRITGRLKDAIIRGGENIYAREVEEALAGHPAIAQVSVVGAPHPVWGEVVAAVIRLRPDVAAPATEALHHFCRERLAPYKTPEVWFFVAEFPLTSSGKIQKFRLRELISQGELTPMPFVKPQRRQVHSA